MKITREINGQLHEFELTSEELRFAFEEKLHEHDRQDVVNDLTEYSPKDFEEEYGVKLDDVIKRETLIEAMAYEMRRNIYKYDMGWLEARDKAIRDVVIRNTKELTSAKFLEEQITVAENIRDSMALTSVEMGYAKMVSLFRDVERTKAGHVEGMVVITADSFAAPYSEEARTYIVSSNNKAFQSNMGGYSIFATSLDGSDVDVRLEGYLSAEKGGKGGWKIERCYMKKNEFDKANSLVSDKNLNKSDSR